jgi:hypothetical protein
VRTTMTAGSIYSLLVLQEADGSVKAAVLTDAKRAGTVPSGGVNTGGGGTAGPQTDGLSALTAVLTAMLVLGVVTVVMVGGGLLASRVVATRPTGRQR